MRSTPFILCAVLLAAPAASAQQFTIVLDSTLYVDGSQSRPWINIEDCDQADAVEFLLDWSLPNTATAVWLQTLKADVFLSTANDCASVSIDIDNVDPTADAQIELGQTTGQYPEDADELFLADFTGTDTGKLNCAGAGEVDYYFCIKFVYEYDEGFTTYTYTHYAAEPVRFDVKAPAAIVLTSVDPGENNLKLSWEAPAEDDIGGFLIQHRVEGDTAWIENTETDEGRTDDTLVGLEIGVTYEVRVAAVDTAGNTGAFSTIETGTPQLISDGWEYYKEQGGTEPGGFCFVATAAYGSYDAELVQPLRRFRDQVLAPSEAGRSFVAAYYQYGPRWARAIRSSEASRGVARAALVPVVGLALAAELGAVEWLLLLGGFALLGWLLWRGRRALGQLARRATAPLLALAVVAGGLALPDQASATEPVAQLQIRFGPYYPNVDDGLAAQPFKTIYGGSSEFLFEIGVDWEFWRPFGAFALGGSAGFTQFLGKGMTAEGERSTDTTVFNLVPLKLTLGYHFDVLAERWSIPLVPYVQAGLCYYVWWILNGVGDVAKWTDPQDDSEHTAQGGLWGLHWGVGLKLLLDFIDEEAAGHLETEIGIVNTYLFAEYSGSWASNFDTGGHFDVGAQTFMLGLMMEF